MFTYGWGRGHGKMRVGHVSKLVAGPAGLQHGRAVPVSEGTLLLADLYTENGTGYSFVLQSFSLPVVIKRKASDSRGLGWVLLTITHTFLNASTTGFPLRPFPHPGSQETQKA